jgi:hypothetical protein
MDDARVRAAAVSAMRRGPGLEGPEGLPPALLQDAHEIDDVIGLGDRVRDGVRGSADWPDHVHLPTMPKGLVVARELRPASATRTRSRAG